MTLYGKYLIIEAATLEARKRHRVHIEQALQNNNLSAAKRTQLIWKLKESLEREEFAQQAQDECDQEEREKKKKSGDGETGDGGQSDAGGSDSGGTAGSASGGAGGITESEEGEDYSEIEMLELLFFLAEMDSDQSVISSVVANDLDIGASLAAATLLFNRHEKIAHVDMPYQLEQGDNPHSPTDLLPALEGHAAQMGAHELHVAVHPDAIALFKNKFGYEPHGTLLIRKGVTTQRMRKSLTASQLLKNNAL